MHDFGTAISPIDGRYHSKTRKLEPFLSERALMQYRVRVEAAWLLALDQHPQIPVQLSNPTKQALQKYKSIELSLEQFSRIKTIESELNHDVKAVEYFLEEKLLEQDPNFKEAHWIHFACTSEDINSSAYAWMYQDLFAKVLLPELYSLIEMLNSFAKEYKSTAMLSFTHGQPASPTTFGKEIAVFSHRIRSQYTQLKNQKFCAKMSGAVGNYHAHQAAFTHVDWQDFSKNFLNSLGVSQNPVTTQIESHDQLIEVLDNTRRINRIWVGFCQDMWTYISKEYLKLKTDHKEVGSSTMPHKVNPIDFENAEGNFEIACSLAVGISSKLAVSRLQRDLSDSTTMRSVGQVWAYTLIAIDSLKKGLDKITADAAKMLSDLNSHPEVLTEAVQTCLRASSVQDAYERLKKFSRGQKINREMFDEFVKSQDELSHEYKKYLTNLKPESYIGIAEKLVDQVIHEKN